MLELKAKRIFDALLGLLIAAVCTIFFVLYLFGFLLVDADTVVFLFLAGGVCAGVGLYFVYRLVPRRVQSSLFAGYGGVPLQPVAPDQDLLHAESVEHETESLKASVAGPATKPAELIRNSNRRETISRYKTREGLGAMGLVIVFLFASALPARLPIGWGFLWLGIAGGGAVALVLGRWRQVSSVSGYAIPVAGGLVGAVVICGMGIVMARFHFLRDFLGMAVAGGIAVALFLRWGRLREGSSRSLI